MRLDKFLKVSRILKRRSVAADACDLGRVLVNDREAKPSKQLKIGDIVEVSFSGGALRLEVLSLNEKANKEQAQFLYKVLD